MLIQIKNTLFFTFFVVGAVFAQDLKPDPSEGQEYRLFALPKDLDCDELLTTSYIILDSGEVRTMCGRNGEYTRFEYVFFKPDGSRGFIPPSSYQDIDGRLRDYPTRYGIFMPSGLIDVGVDYPEFTADFFHVLYDPISGNNKNVYQPKFVEDRFSEGKVNYPIPQLSWSLSAGNLLTAMVGPGVKGFNSDIEARLQGDETTLGVIFWDLIENKAWLVRISKDIQVAKYGIADYNQDVTNETENFASVHIEDTSGKSYNITCSAYEGVCVDNQKIEGFVAASSKSFDISYAKNGDTLIRIKGKKDIDFHAAIYKWRGTQGYKLIRLNDKVTALKPTPSNAYSSTAIEENIHGEIFGQVALGIRDPRSRNHGKSRVIKWTNDGKQRFDLSHYFPKNSSILKSRVYFAQANDCGDVVFYPQGSGYRKNFAEKGPNSGVFLLIKQRDRTC